MYLKHLRMSSTNKQQHHHNQDELHSVHLIPAADREVLGVVSGVVYSPNEVDEQGDWTSQKEIENVAHAFVKKARQISVNHKDRAGAKPVESYIAQGDWQIGHELVKKGSWYIITEVLDAKLWARLESGELGSFSWEGKAKLKPGFPDDPNDL